MTSKSPIHLRKPVHAAKEMIARTIAPAFRIERRRTDTSVEQATDHIQRLVKGRLAGLTAGKQVTESHVSATSFGGFGSAAAFERHIGEWRTSQGLKAMRTMDFTIPVGTTRVVGPPYDHGLAQGAGQLLAEYDGASFAWAVDGLSASGFAIDFNSPDDVLASITPGGTYTFAWTAFDNYPLLSCEGGVGMLAQDVGPPATTVQQALAVLFSLSGVTQFQSDKGSGLFQDAPLYQTDFGPMFIAPLLLNMTAGRTYRVWIWSWTFGQNMSGKAFLGDVVANIPFISVGAQTPIIVH